MKKFFVIIGKILMVGIIGILAVRSVWAEGAAIDGAKVELPELYIKAINPGYTVDGVNNVGEMIELARKNSDEPMSLAGTIVRYTTSSGNTQVLAEFPENSWMTGESILLRLASSPESELAALSYKKTLAFKAGIILEKGEVVLDAICWTGKDDCVKEFKSTQPTTLVRNLESLEFEHLEEYEPKYDEKSYLEEEIVVSGEKKDVAEKDEEEEKEEEKKPQCKGIQFSEILSFYETARSEQFIELYNPMSEQILLDGCRIRYKNKEYALSGIVKAEGYLTYLPIEFNLAKNPTNVGILEIIDVDDAVVDKLEYPNGQRKATSYAQIGYDADGKEVWRLTYAPTPGEGNNYQEFKTCEEGKVINEATGNCVKVVKVEEKICEVGYYLNPLTGRCKKYETPKIITCKEGYYLNEETGRCRKIQENTGASYELETREYEEKSSFVALYAVIGIMGVGLLYIIYEFRKNITNLLKRIFGRVSR